MPPLVEEHVGVGGLHARHVDASTTAVVEVVPQAVPEVLRGSGVVAASEVPEVVLRNTAKGRPL